MSKGNTEDIYPLSPMQEGMLFHALYAPESRAYFVQESYAIRGDLEPDVLRRAWQQVMERHAVLRTSFFWERKGPPLQVVSRQVRLPWDEQDWRALSRDEQQERLQAFHEADREQGFDLARPPLFRLSLIRMADEEFQFVWRFHHLLLDMWSVSSLLKEVLRFYDAYRQGRTLELERPRPFRDYISWLRRQDSGGAESFWRDTLKGFTAATPLAVDGATAAISNDHEQEGHAKLNVKLSVGATQALQSAARQHQLTLNTFIQGAWALLLSRYSREADVVFGNTVSGRPTELADAESMVGLFINTLPVRVRVPADRTLLDWLRELQSEQVKAWQYAYAPLVQVHGWSEVPRREPLFESLLVFENLPGAEDYARKRDSGLEIDSSYSFDQTQYPLALIVWPGAELSVEIHYDSRRFDSQTITRMLGHYRLLLENFAANPHARLSRISLLTEDERQCILFDWNDTARDYTQPHLLHALFEAQVRRTPSLTALRFEDQELSYSELNRRANQLAHHLLLSGVKPDTPVAILMQRSTQLVVALLATLKAGAAYLPLDPSYPHQRLSLMLSEAAPAVLLTQQQTLSQLPELQSAGTTFCLDTDWQQVAAHSTDNPVLALWPENLAYIIYTSGSTGRPKGAMNTHGAICNRLLWMQEAYGLDDTDSVLQKTTISFDVSVWEFFWPLITGARLVLARPDGQRDGKYLVEVIGEQSITTMHFVPAMLQQFLEEEGLEELRSLRRVISSGEALLWPVEQRFFERLGWCELHNLYGPTEVAVDVTSWRCARSETEEVVPIGRPIANTQIYILDERFEIVPIGVIGEIYIGGAGLARGYLSQPEMTAERFIPSPHSRTAGGRLYWTGDEGRYQNDGAIEYVGRCDEQVKVRGYRIELGEIEAALTEHESVREAVVVARDEAGAGKRLVGYVVIREGAEIGEQELRSYLRERLPEFMVPSVLLKLDALPLTGNGKVDRRALPAPGPERPNLMGSFLAARTPVEEVLANIWAAVLGLEQVGINDNFFDLGGHSLLATQVLMRVREALRVEMPLRTLFEQPTVSRFAQSLEAAQRAGLGLEIPDIEPVARDQELPLSFAQHRLWFLDQLQPGNTAYNMPIAVRLTGKLEVKAVEASLNEVIRRHEVLRTSFVAVEGHPVQVINPPKTLTLNVEDLTGCIESDREAEALRLAKEEANRPFDLSGDTLLRVKLIRLGEEDHVMLATMHHIASDGWSIGILIRELAALYAAFSTGLPSPLPELPIQYADYAHWQREWLQGSTLDQQLSYWRQQLSDAPPLLQLPTDRPRPPVQSYHGAQTSLVLDEQLTRSITALSHRAGVTLFMTLLAALQSLLFRYSHQPDILVSTGIANRTRAEIEPLIGFFVNTLVLRSRLSPHLRFTELLSQVREVTLSAYAHQDLPFELLVEALQPERNPSYTPIFQVMMVLQNAPLERVSMEGLEIRQMGGEAETAKFDLTLFMEEKGGRIEASLEYNTDLFDERTARQMLEAYEQMLGSVGEDAEQELMELRMLSVEDEREMMQEWEAATQQQQEEQGEEQRAGQVAVHQWFSRVAGEMPAEVAIAAERQVSYEELERESNRLANLLLSRGAERGQIIAILTQDTIEMITCSLGVLKAGCAFMPLDVSLPDKRLAAMLSVAPPSFFICDAQQTGRITHLLSADNGRLRFISVDGQVNEADDRYLGNYHNYEESSNPAVARDGDELCYIYFTSGSTGVPKAIAGRLKAIDHFIQWEIETLGLNAGIRVSNLLAPTFDGSLRDIFVPLCTGGTICIPPSRDVLLDIPRLVQWIDEQRIELMHCVPSLLRAIVNEPLRDEQFQSLRYVLLAGEALLPADVERWMNVFDERVQLVNLYGASETTLVKLCYFVRKGDELRATIPVGMSISGASVLLLDERGRLCPAGAVGEIYIETQYRSLGYYNQPELTAEAFVPHPFSHTEGEVLYRTGDMGRQLEDGGVEYLGRRDQQVKVRGQRVELSEVESAVRAQSGVADVAVISREDGSGYSFLCAYVVLGDNSAGQAEMVQRLRSGIAEELPDYMMPSAIVVMEEMPRTISGKVDRRALPEPELGRMEVEFVATRTPVEEVVAGVWREVLGRERVSVVENFFHIGGHSLLATQVLSRVREVFAVEVPLRRLFEEPTVEGLARAVEAELRTGAGVSVPPLQAVSRAEEMPLSFAQQRLWFLDQLEPGSSAYNMPAAVRLSGYLNVDALELALSEIIRRHEVLRTTFTLSSGEPIQVIGKAEALKLGALEFSGLNEEEREREARRLTVEEAARPFDLSRGPLLRVSLLRLAETEHVLLVTMHHIVSDGWSMGVLVHELATLYSAFAAGEPSPLPELPIQYADYAVWQRQWLTEAALEKELAYWRQHLSATPPVLKLPAVRLRGAEDESLRGASQLLLLSPELSAAIKTLGQREGVTLFMMLLANLQVLLHYYTGQDDIIVGTDIANRNRPETEKLIGFFINMLPLRTNLSGDPTFTELLKRVREVCLGAYAHQDVPFVKIVEGLRLERELGRNPLFQVVLVLQNFPRQPVEVSEELTLRPLGFAIETAKFDLQLTLEEWAGGLGGSFEYNLDLFSAATVARLAGHFQQLLETVVEQPEIRLSTLVEALKETDRRQQAIKQQEFRESRHRKLKDMIVEPVGGLAQKG